MSTTLPAEWAPQTAVMLTWPREDGDFAKSFAAVEQNFILLAQGISRFQPLWINREHEPEKLRQRLLDAGVPAERLTVFAVPSDDVWARDHGPITVLRNGRGLHLDFTFNGWGGKFESARDNRITREMDALKAFSHPVETVDFVLEGGGIESDGGGTLLTTERCLLASTRNPTMNREQIEDLLKRQLGLRRVLWLKRGDMLGDDTDGHIDTVARFCDPATIAYQACEDRNDAHFEELRAMAEELAAFRTDFDRPYKLVPLPLPAPIHDDTGRRLPAGYANFLILNNAVLVPIYADANDGEALNRLRPCFPGRHVIGVDCRALIEQYGSLHCVTMQIPKLP